MSLKSDGIPDIDDLWDFAIEKYGPIKKSAKPAREPNKPPQKEKNNMNKNRFKKTYILIAAYILLIIIELFVCVPYNKIQIFISTQNVPHTEIVGNGYSTMSELGLEYTQKYGRNEGRMSATRVNTPQLFMNISITTILAVAIYFLLQKDEKINNIPELDFESIAFSTEEEVKQAQKDYARKMYEYIKGKEKI